MVFLYIKNPINDTVATKLYSLIQNISQLKTFRAIYQYTVSTVERGSNFNEEAGVCKEGKERFKA